MRERLAGFIGAEIRRAPGACSMNPKLDIPPPPVTAAHPDAGAQEPASAAAIEWRAMFGDPQLRPNLFAQGCQRWSMVRFI